MTFKIKKIAKYFPVIFLIFIALVFFYKFFIYKLISMPVDITVGMYYPWLDQKWSGLTTNVPVKNPLMSDIVSIIYQWRILAIDSLKQGHFPFWTQSYLSGVPLFANFQNSLLNPTNFPFFFFENNGVSWTLMVLTQLIFSLLASYFCLRVLKFEKISSIVGSIVYSFSLFNIVWLEYGIHTYVAAFLPLFVVCIEKYSQKKQNRYLVYLSLLVSLQFYGGYPQYSIFSLIFISLYYFLIHSKYDIKSITKILFSLLLGLLLTLPLLIPGYELIKLSIRNIDTTSQDQTLGFLPFQNILTLPVPNYWGNPTTYDYYGSGFYDNNAIFPGSIALIALFFSIYLFIKHKTDKRINLFIFTIIFSTLISVENPFSLFLKNNLGFIFSGNGISTRIFLLANFSFSVISAYLINFIIHNKHKKILPILFILFWQIIIILNLFFQKNTNSISLKNTLYTLIFTVPILTTLIISLFIKRYKNIFLYLTIFLIICEHFYYGLKYLPFSKQEYLFPTTPSIEYLQNNVGNHRISTSNTIPTNMWVPYGLRSSDGYDTTMPLINFEYYSLLQNNQFSLTAKRAIHIDNEKSSLYPNLSIKYKLTLGDEKPISKEKSNNQFFTVFGEKNTIIQENKNVLPKIRFIDQVVFVADKFEFQQLYSKIDFSQTAVLYNQNKNDFKNVDLNCQAQNKKIEIINDSDNSIIFNSINNCPSLVFISNSFYPGWKVYIDENPIEIYQTNHAFQSILLPSGRHHIVLSYQPENFKISLIIASISFIILLVTFICDLVLHKKRNNLESIKPNF